MSTSLFSLPGEGSPTAPAPSARRAPHEFDLEGMPISELLALRNAIEQKLPAKDLKDLDLSRELVLQVLALQQLQHTVLNSEDTPANQQAQVANSLSSALTTLVKLQSEVQTSERLKKIEATLVEVMQAQPKEMQEAFFAAYEERLTSS
jgi:galactose-1-phosphate uridylyltransferase